MRFHSEFSTNALRELERLTESLRAKRSIGNGSYRSISEIDNVFVSLGRQLVDHDDLRFSVGCEEELVFRTARLVIDAQLGRIEQAIRTVLEPSLANASEVPAWGRFLEAIPLARKELQRITNLWLPYRNHEAGLIATSDSSAYKDAIRAAFAELRKLDEHPDVERMLYRGIAATKWPEIASACEQILVAIHVRIDLQAARALWVARSKWARALGRQ